MQTTFLCSVAAVRASFNVTACVPPACLPPVCLQGTLFPMCGMNLAFDRTLIGPAMYFGMMGEGQPWGRYDGECIHCCPGSQALPPVSLTVVAGQLAPSS